MDSNERSESPLSNSGGLKQRWHQNCSDKESIISDLVSPDSATIMPKKKTIWFSCVHKQRILNESLSRVYNTPLKIKRSYMDSRPPKIL
jgi:hypothetical protein